MLFVFGWSNDEIYAKCLVFMFLFCACARMLCCCVQFRIFTDYFANYLI